MRRLIKNKRGMSAVIGAIFSVIVFLAGFTFIMWEVTQYDNNQQVINDRTHLDQDQKNEILDISQPSTEGTTGILFNVTNQGSVTAHIVTIWITEHNGTLTVSQFGPIAESTYVNPGTTVAFNKTLTHLNPGSSYMVKVVTERGNIVEKGWASLQTVLTIKYAPPSLYQNRIVTISGELTCAGATIPAGKTVNLFYRLSGGDWIALPDSPSTIDGGAYSYQWNVGVLAPGYYLLKANFTGDADYPSCSVLSDSVGVDLLQDPTLTISCSTSIIEKNDTVTVSGVLTSEGAGISEKTISIYRSSGSSWVLVSSNTTLIGTGAYIYTWRVPSNLPSGNYHLKAVFDGDIQYPGRTTENVSLQVLDPIIGISVLYYPPTVHLNENVTIYGTLVSDGVGVGSQTVSLYYSSGASWVWITNRVTSADGSYSYDWNVTNLAPNSYRLKANYTGDSFYPSCSMEVDYVMIPVPVTALSLLYYPPTVHKNENVSIFGDLTRDGIDFGGKTVNLYYSTGTTWTSITSVTTGSDGAYSYDWNVTNLAPNNYRLKANYSGDSYFPSCSVEVDYVEIPVPVTALTLLYYPPTVHLNENVTITGVLTNDGHGFGSQTVNIYRSSGSSWTAITTATTAADGSYSAAWNVSNLAPGSYRLKVNFTGDSYYPSCSVQSDYVEIPVPVTALSLLFYPPTVHLNGNVSIYGSLTSDGAGLGSKTVNIYRSSGSSWVSIDTHGTAADGSYSYDWNVTNLAPGNYRLKVNFSGDSYYPACSVENEYVEIPVPVTALTLLYYAPVVHRNQNVTVYGTLTADSVGMASKTISLYRSNGGSWVLIGTDGTSADGSYFFEWNVSTLTPGNYLLKANYTGDSYYPACQVQSDPIEIAVPTTALTLTYYPPIVSRYENVTLSGILTGDGDGIASKTVTFYWSNSTTWIQIGTTTTVTSGVYAYDWNVSNLSPGHYRLRANFSGDGYYPACSVDSDSIGLQIDSDLVQPGTGGGLSAGPFSLIFSDTSFTYTSNGSSTNRGAAYQIDNDNYKLVFSVEIKNQATKNIQISYLSFFLVEVRQLSGVGQPGTMEQEDYFQIVNSTSTSASLVSYPDFSQSIGGGNTTTLKFAASTVGGTSFVGGATGEPLHQQGSFPDDDNWENLCWTYLVLFWRYEGDANTFGQTIAYVAIRSTG